MSRKFVVPFMLIFALALFGCNLTSTGTTLAATVIPISTATVSLATAATPSAATLVDAATSIPINTAVPTATVPAATATLAPSATSVPAPTHTAAPVYNPSTAKYIDDRSTPSLVIVSLFNAINRQEYLRAYNYWTDPANSLGSFTSYAAGYQDTASVGLVFGQISGDAGMSQIHFTVPVILKATARNGTHSNFAACYIVHETSPDVYGAPPFAPMGIDQGSAKVADMNASDSSVLATACSGSPSGPMVVPVVGESLNIDKNNFVDNRSGPIETVSSFLNALNLKQYVRAYSYYQDPSSYPGAYGPYAAGYANTDVITVTFGTVQSQGALGSLYYKVPLAMHVLTTSSSTQTFVGCYTLRLGQPAVQATPPFQPMGIVAGKFSQVANSTNVSALLPTACN
jgi:hypothetical protein